jgi:hypothetical protein
MLRLYIVSIHMNTQYPKAPHRSRPTDQAYFRTRTAREEGHISTLHIGSMWSSTAPSTPEAHPIQDPVRLGWEPLVKIEHYHVGAEQILAAEIRVDGSEV